jgi:hypothetical protein
VQDLRPPDVQSLQSRDGAWIHRNKVSCMGWRCMEVVVMMVHFTLSTRVPRFFPYTNCHSVSDQVQTRGNL